MTLFLGWWASFALKTVLIQMLFDLFCCSVLRASGSISFTLVYCCPTLVVLGLGVPLTFSICIF